MSDVKLTIKTLVLLPMWPLIVLAVLLEPWAEPEWWTCGGHAVAGHG